MVPLHTKSKHEHCSIFGSNDLNLWREVEVWLGCLDTKIFLKKFWRAHDVHLLP
jgi:hypothetical protein